MATKTLTITEEAYERLRAHKRVDESFTDTILRITDPDRDPMAGFGAMADVDGFREVVEGTRERLDDDLDQRRQRRAGGRHDHDGQHGRGRERGDRDRNDRDDDDTDESGRWER